MSSTPKTCAEKNTTARLVTGLVIRKMATAIGRVTLATRSGTSMASRMRSTIKGSVASEEREEKATAEGWGGGGDEARQADAAPEEGEEVGHHGDADSVTTQAMTTYWTMSPTISTPEIRPTPSASAKTPMGRQRAPSAR